MKQATVTQVLKVDSSHPDDTQSASAIRIAAAAIRAGQLVAFPTETVYGLGANALDAAAIERIYAAKQRPANDPIIAHIADLDQLRALAVDIPAVAFDLAKVFWPGALTFVLKRADSVPGNIATGRDTVAVRMPANAIANALIRAAGVPIAAPSANTFTRPSATTADHVLQDLGGRIDIILDGGATSIGLESTVLDLTGAVPVVLRPGGVIMDDILGIVPHAQFQPQFQSVDTPTSSPGQMLKHYSPHAQMVLYRGLLYSVLIAMREAVEQYEAAGKRVGVLVADEDTHHFEGVGLTHALGKRADLKAISHNLFAGLRELDTHGVDVILTRDFGRAGLGAALWDRLLRAAEGHVIDV